jgi:hypothetical protein
VAETVYILCALASLACAVLLLRGYLRTRTRLLLWSCLCFVFLFINNILLFADKVLLPDVHLASVRSVTALSGLALLLYGLVFDSE